MKTNSIKDQLISLVGDLDENKLEKVLSELLLLKKKPFVYTDIKSFDDACEKLNISAKDLPDVSCIPLRFRKANIVNYKLSIIYEAINEDWVADFSDSDQYKYYPYFKYEAQRSSGGSAADDKSAFGFSYADCDYIYDDTYSDVGGFLCTNTSEKAKYMGTQFEDLYNDLLIKQ